MKDSLIHIVGGGHNQLPAVQAAKALGLRVLVTDMYSDPPCREEADFFHQVDITDKEETLEIARAHNVKAVMTDQSDIAVPTVAYVADNLGIKGIGYSCAIRFTNKHAMRESIAPALPNNIPEYHLFETVKAATLFANSLRSPSAWIVKPVNSQGSRGVAVLLPESIQEQINDAFVQSKSRGILIERRIRGFEYSVEGWVKNKQVLNLACTKKFHFPSNNCIDFRNTYLGDVSEELEQQLFQINSHVIQAMGLPFGVTHTEFMVEDGRIYVMEIAARGGGGSISSKIIPYLTGFDPNVALIHELFDQPYQPSVSDYKNRFVVMKFFEFKPGLVNSVSVNRSQHQGILHFQLDIKPGDEIREVKDSRDRTGYFVVGAESPRECLLRERRVEDSVSINYKSV